MKKMFTLPVVMCLLLGISTAKAQLQQGNFLLGADLANFKLALNEGGDFNINLSPKLGFFFKNNLALGVYVDFGLFTAKGAGTSVDYGVGAFGRYYISDPTVNLLRHSRFFFEGTAGINGTNPASGETTNGLGLSFGPGLVYFITQQVGLETLLKYQGIVGFGSRTTSSDLVLNFGLQVYLPSGRRNK